MSNILDPTPRWSNIRISSLLVAFAISALGFSPAAMAAATVTSLTLSPSTIAGGSGATSTATVTLSEPAPSGGTLVTIGTSNSSLAASVRSVTIPAGSTSATVAVATNAFYRRYSALAFNATISATAGGVTRNATLGVTSQARPTDIDGDSTQRFGTVCGGSFPASKGDHGILFNCVVGPDFGTVGKCSFRQECLLGCTTKPSQNFQFFDVCATSGPYPIQVSPAWIEGGNRATATLFLANPAPSGTNALLFGVSSVSSSFPTGYFSVPTGATSVNTVVATSIVPSAQFVEVDANFEIPTPIGGGSIHNADRTGLVWLAIAPPPQNPPAVPQPVLGYVSIDPEQVNGNASAFASIWLSGLVQSGANPVTVALTSSHPGIAPVPPSVSIGQGSNVASFSIQTTNPTQTTTVTITATEGPRTVTDTLVVAASTCVPTTCAAQGYQCGTPSNGCGGFLTCGTCLSPQVCTFQNVCCTPETCASQGKNCGNINDLCGGFPDCGTCTPPQTCQFGVCGCTPTTCAAQGKNCGSISDGCGGTLICGTCTSPQTCGGGGTPNVCGSTSAVSLSSLTLNPTSVKGGNTSQATVTLSGPAPSGGAVITLSSSNTSAATVPASVTVSAGQTGRTFTVSTQRRSSTTTVNISATYGGVTKTAGLTVTGR